MQYIVAIEYRIEGGKKVHKEYRECETIEEAKGRAELWTKMFKDECELFDVRIYELTNY